jgi:RNA-splicing ligase RtcB
MTGGDRRSGTIEIEGEHTTAEIKTEAVDESCIEQVETLVDHEAFRNPVRVMPDAHAGAGAVIGFTMELGDRICPNTVGVDIGCGVAAVRLGDTDRLADEFGSPERLRELDERIRTAVPLGRSTFGDEGYPAQEYHLVDDFPWERCEAKLSTLNEGWDGRPIESPGYGKEYFLGLCDRLGYSPKRAIDSLGTLGGGNHFVEIARSEETGAFWAVVHSGSRGIGLTIAEYWQEQAHRACDDRAATARARLAEVDSDFYRFDLDEVTDRNLLNWLQGGMGEDWKAMDAVAARFEDSDPDRIDEIHGRLKAVTEAIHEEGDGDDLDYLEGADRHGYLRDMVFAQTYAAESRRVMTRAVADALDAAVEETIESTHNYIDFEDRVIRKGATRVHEGERAIVPFNMRDGAIIVRGKGADAWNRSAPHGAGRRGSRRWAHEEFSVAEFADEMDGVFSTSVSEATLDEAPMAYKHRDVVLDRIEETATVEETLTPVFNLKADD